MYVLAGIRGVARNLEGGKKQSPYTMINTKHSYTEI